MKCPKDANNWVNKGTDEGGCQSTYKNTSSKGNMDAWTCTRDLNHKGQHHHHYRYEHKTICELTWTDEELVIEAL